MHREHHRWYSPTLNRDMELIIAGHAGARVLVFPTSKGRYYEWEDRKMFQVLGESLANGRLQLICVDSVDEESWYAHWKRPSDRAWRQEQYNNYLLNEVLPLSWQKNPNPFLMTIGASFGAYHAVNFALRYPQIVSRTIGMSGVYDISRWSNGHQDRLIYLNNPMAYIPGERDEKRLNDLQKLDIILAVGRDDGLCDNNRTLSGLLWAKGIGNALRLWDGWSHDWPYWEQMIQIYINGSD